MRAAEGLAWCSGCEAWLNAEEVIKNGACRPCTNRKDRERYQADRTYRQSRQKRSSARRRGVSPVPAAAQELLLEEFEGRCAYCGEPATSWDHIVAVKQGGVTEPANIVPCCTSCNSSKRDRDVWQWLGQKKLTPHDRFFERVALAETALFPPNGRSAIDT